MLNDSHIFAQMSGNIVVVPCVPIAIYRFVNSPYLHIWSHGSIDPSTLIIQHKPRLADCVLSATTRIAVDNQTYSYRAKTGTLTNVT